MQKLMTFLLVVIAALTASAQTSKVLFDNPDAPMLSWSSVCSLTAGDVAGIKAGDIIEVTVAEVKSDCDWPKFGFEANGSSNYPEAFEMWTRRDNLPYVAKFTVTEADLALLSGGFEIKGDGVRITKVCLVTVVSEELPEGQTLLFNNEDAPMLSWSVACSVTAAQVSGIKAGDVIEVTVAGVKADCEWPKFGFEADGKSNYPEAFEMWTRRDNLPYVAKFIVTEADIELLAGGFDIKGDGVRLTRAVFVKTVSAELPEGHTLIYDNENAPTLSWSTLCSVTAAQVGGIKAGDAFQVTVKSLREGCEWPKFGFESGDHSLYPEAFEMWGDKTMPYVATYYVTEADAGWLADGFDIKGDGVQITRVELVARNEAGNQEIVLWSGAPTLMTWGEGPVVAAGSAATIAAGDVLEITISEIVASSQWPKVVCRSENGWEEIFTVELWDDAGAEMPMVKTVSVTDEMLPLLSEGFNFGGEGAYIEKVALVKGQTGVKNVVSGVSGTPFATVYNLNGVCLRRGVDAADATAGLPAGIYIVNGKKMIVR